jgi:hypothetical protein
MKEDIIKDIKRHAYYLKPGEKKRTKAALARKRAPRSVRETASLIGHPRLKGAAKALHCLQTGTPRHRVAHLGRMAAHSAIYNVRLQHFRSVPRLNWGIL